MRIIRAEHAGFCYGVRRAARLAAEAAGCKDRPVYTLGPLMHNPQEVARLAAQGIQPRERIEDCVGGRTLVRTHGVAREVFQRARELGIELVDATCPRVKVPHGWIERLGREGRHVVILGDAGHPEVRALQSYACGPVTLVERPDRLPDLPPGTPLGLVAQTTQTKEAFSRLESALRARFADLVAHNTICLDSEQRQQEGRQLAACADVVLVVGGRNSANTNRLTHICRAVQPRTHHLESVREIEGVDLNGAEVVVVASGASTPDWIIDELESRLQKSLKNR